MLSKKYITTPVIAAFGIMGISGVLMFFHIKDSGIVTMHEWIGILFVIVAVLHVVVNWKAFSSYFSKAATILPMLVILAVGAGVYGVNSAGEGGNPVKKVVGKLTQVPLSDVAPALGMSTDEAIAKLKGSGIGVESELDSVATIAGLNGQKSFDLLGILVK